MIPPVKNGMGNPDWTSTIYESVIFHGQVVTGVPNPDNIVLFLVKLCNAR